MSVYYRLPLYIFSTILLIIILVSFLISSSLLANSTDTVFTLLFHRYELLNLCKHCNILTSCTLLHCLQIMQSNHLLITHGTFLCLFYVFLVFASIIRLQSFVLIRGIQTSNKQIKKTGGIPMIN